MKIELDLYRPFELDAFAAFCTAVAAARRKMRPSEGDLDVIEKTEDLSTAATAERRHTFEVPEGHVAVRDKEGRATGETVPAPAAEATAPAPVAEAPKKRGRKPKADATPPAPEGNGNISDSPEDRTDPQNPEPADDAATQAADAADEAAETAANSDGKLTHDDVRNVLGKYRTAYGMEAAMVDGPIILQEVCGEGVVKISSIPEDQIAAVIDAVKAAGKANRFERAVVTE